MRHLRHYHTLAIVAVFALSVSLFSTSSTDAWPLREGALESAQLIKDTGIDTVQLLQKRQTPKLPVPKPDPTEDEPTKPTTPPKEPSSKPPAQTPTTTAHPTTAAPKPSSNPPPAQPTTSNKPAATSHSSSGNANTSTSSRGQGAVPTGNVPTTGGGSDDSEGVPTGVSQKVLIGLGTVGGMIVFAMGGLAFCRHRRKKNLAKALLQQTAQFNNNNPYAKLSEPSTPAKESLPMTPTKPLGSCTAVSAYIPNLADEIEIGMGDNLTILQEYDDGWCFGANNTRNGIQGVFPRFVFENHGGNGGQEGPGYYPPEQGFKPMTNKRMSSIPPGGWNNGPPAYNGGGGYGNHPPQGQNYYNQGGY